MEPIGKSLTAQILASYTSASKKKSSTEGESSSAISDSAEISNTSKAFNKVNEFLNLGSTDRLNLDDLNDGEKKEFLKMLSDLIKKGVVGYEVLEVNGRPEKHYIDMEIGDRRIYGARLYRKKDINEYPVS
jgi:hypothetical protein